MYNQIKKNDIVNGKKEKRIEIISLELKQKGKEKLEEKEKREQLELLGNGGFICFVRSTSFASEVRNRLVRRGRKRHSGNAPPGLGRAVVWPPPEEGGKRGAGGATFLQRAHRTCCMKNRKSRKRRKRRAT